MEKEGTGGTLATGLLVGKYGISLSGAMGIGDRGEEGWGMRRKRNGGLKKKNIHGNFITNP